MTLAATFLGGAKSRLLPPSVPFRFFTVAAVFHVLMWLALLLGTTDAIGFRGGLGPGLATVHLLALGVLTTTAMGAAAQLLPVATRRALAAIWPIKLVFWLFVPGMLLLIVGMHAASPAPLIVGAVTAMAGLLIFAGLLADNLRRASSLPVVAAYGWAALAALLALVALGLGLAIDYRISVLPNHAGFALAHMILGGFGFMGLLVLGFSHVLVPMFALASAPAKLPSFASFLVAVAALVLDSLGAVIDNRGMLILAAFAALGAAAMHLWLMYRVLATGMRKRLGLSFVLVRAAWAMLPMTFIIGLASLYDVAGPNGPTLFGFMLIGGWLLTFLLGILQRILPFLASMHIARPERAASAPFSELTAEALLKFHAACHGLAIITLAVSIAIDDVMLARIGAAIGLVGSVAFAWFTLDIIRKVLPSTRA